MSQSITTDVGVHLEGSDVTPECQTLVTSSGRSFTVLRVGPVTFYVTQEQLRSIRGTIAAYLCEESDDDVPADDPSWDVAGYWTPSDDRLIGTDSMGADVWESDARIDPADFAMPPIMGGSEEAYQPSEADLAEWADFLHALEADLPDRDQVEPYRAGMPTEDELAQLASHGCV
jgi:hypothetical protein